MFKSEAFGGLPDALKISPEWGVGLHEMNRTQTGYSLSNALYPTSVLDAVLAWAQSCRMVIPLKVARNNAKLSQDALAEAVNSGRSTIVKLEKGTLPLTQSWALRLAGPLGLTYDQLWAGPPLPNAEELENMIGLAMDELPVGATNADYARVVASSLRSQLEQYQAAGGLRQNPDAAPVPDKAAPTRQTTMPDARA